MNHLDSTMLITVTCGDQSVLGGLRAWGNRMELHKLDSPSTAKLRPISEPPRSRCLACGLHLRRITKVWKDRRFSGPLGHHFQSKGLKSWNSMQIAAVGLRQPDLQQSA